MKFLVYGLVVLALMLVPAQLMAFASAEFIYSNWDFAGGAAYGFSGDNHTYDYASLVNFYDGSSASGPLGEWIGTQHGYPDDMNWAHTLPNGLSVPPDHILRARLWIDGYEIDNNENEIRIEGTFDWDPLNDHLQDNTTYNLAHVDEPGFWNDGTIDCRITAGERRFRLDRSILMLDYCQEQDQNVVPEPGTLMLLGLGLAGIGTLRRRTK